MRRLSLLAIFVLLLQACSAIPHRTQERTARADSRTIIYVARRGWHIDIGFALADLAAPLAAVNTDFPTARYLFFGFGDRHYLVAKNKNFPGMLGALWPGAGVILASGIAGPPEMAFDAAHVVRLVVSPAQARAAQAFVWRSLLKDGGPPRVYAPGPYANSLYYSAVPRYSALYTCNTWAAQALEAAPIAVHSFGVVFAGQLWSQLQQFNGKAVARSPSDETSALTLPGGS